MEDRIGIEEGDWRIGLLSKKEIGGQDRYRRRRLEDRIGIREGNWKIGQVLENYIGG